MRLSTSFSVRPKLDTFPATRIIFKREKTPLGLNFTYSDKVHTLSETLFNPRPFHAYKATRQIMHSSRQLSYAARAEEKFVYFAPNAFFLRFENLRLRQFIIGRLNDVLTNRFRSEGIAWRQIGSFFRCD